MQNALYIMPTGPRTGKSAIALGTMRALAGAMSGVAIFRPIISEPPANGRDPDIDLLLNHFKLDMDYADTFACTHAAARKLINQGSRSLLLENILQKFKAIQKKYSFVLCIGTDFSGGDPVPEARLNIDIAANLGCPVMLLANGENRDADAIIESVRAALDGLAPYSVAVTAVVINKAKTSDGLKFGNGTLPVYALPDAPDILKPNDTSGIDAALALYERHINSKEIIERLRGSSRNRTTPMLFESDLIERAKSRKMRIVLAEGEEERILKATDMLLRREVADIILLGNVDTIRKKAKGLNLDIAGATLIEPVKSENFEKYKEAYCEFRKSKGMTMERANDIMADATYFATMMVKLDHADGMVSGAVNTTANTIRPAFEFIKTKPGFSVVSSVFLMCLKDRVLCFGDCAVNPNPTAPQLAEIALASADTAVVFGIEPRVAMLSYSTGSSGKGADVDTVTEATKIAREKAPDLALEGPLQYDAAIDPSVAKTKLPDSRVAGRATVFIFPDLNTGNNTYKAVQRAADALAIGPVLQGLNKPVNDLSRGCTVADIVNTVAITAVQAAAENPQIN